MPSTRAFANALTNSLFSKNVLVDIPNASSSLFNSETLDSQLELSTASRSSRDGSEDDAAAVAQA